LLKYTVNPIPIFVMRKENVVHHHYTYRNYSSAELLQLLEDKLKALGRKPTGLTIMDLPDQNWLRNALLHLDPEDPNHLLKREKINDEEELKLVINEE